MIRPCTEQDYEAIYAIVNDAAMAYKRVIGAPTLMGTWAAADWAIRFYQKHGFRLVPPAEKDRLLPKYWGVPQRQIETSVVLGDAKWFAAVGRQVEA